MESFSFIHLKTIQDWWTDASVIRKRGEKKKKEKRVSVKWDKNKDGWEINERIVDQTTLVMMRGSEGEK